MNELFFEALEIMGKGMLGIFIVTVIIILSMFLLNKISERKEKQD